MSTRCQVKVIDDKDPDDAVTLYHHCDGYPTNMLPLIAAAYEPNWEHGRVGKVASFLCAEDPGSFEPESGHELHGDIEWYYILKIKADYDVQAVPVWFIDVYRGDGTTVVGNTTVSKTTTTKSMEIVAQAIEDAE